MAREVVAKAQHGFIVNALERSVGNIVEADEVDAAVQAIEQGDQRAGMVHTVVDTLEHDILETEAALVRTIVVHRSATAEIVLAQQVHQFASGKGALGWHQGLATLVQGMVQADSQMATALVKESLQTCTQSDGTHSDALGAPREAPLRGEHLRGAQHSVDIVEGFALPHKDHVGQRLALGQGINLVENLSCRERRGIPLSPCHTKGAPHLASHLRTDAQGGAVAIGDIDRFDVVAVERAKEILNRTIHRAHCFGRTMRTDGATLSKAFAIGFRDIRHLINGHHALGIQPLRHLLTHKGRHSHFLGQLLEFRFALSQQNDFV